MIYRNLIWVCLLAFVLPVAQANAQFVDPRVLGGELIRDLQPIYPNQEEAAPSTVKVGQSGLIFLSFPTDARRGAMADAGVGLLGDGPAAVFLNPGLLGYIHDREAFFSYVEWIAGTKHSTVGIVWQFPNLPGSFALGGITHDSMFPVIFLFFLPALTMRSWAEERRSGTLELLLTFPVTIGQLIAGKFLASMLYLSLLLVLTLGLPATMWRIPQYLGVHIAAEVCKALDYAHNCSDSENHDPLNLIHKSVSPSNIMLSTSGAVKLNDFGLDTVQAERNLNLPQKVQYMSPEHVSYGTTLDKRSDIFSLGLILYELLEGKRLFLSEDPQEVIAILRNGKLKLKDIRHTPKPLQMVLHKALDKSLDRRYQNANQFYIDLVTYLVLNADTATMDVELANLIREISGDQTPGTAHAEHRIEFADMDANLHEATDTYEQQMDASFPGTETLELASATEEINASKAVPSINLLPEVEETQEHVEEGEDDVKTLIDVVRLSTRGHKKQVMKGVFTVATLLILFIFLDFAFQWTPVGARAYDAVFPPAIKISSMPTGAKVLLNGQALAGTTPVSIDEIDPGIYELQLVVDGYKPIVKSLHVPSKGQIQVQGSADVTQNQTYTFRFKTSLEIDSTPQGAEVYINNIRYSQTTPTSIPWEVGETCEIELRKAGFGKIAGFSLDSGSMREQIEDRRFWSFEMETEPTTQYKISGQFGKFVSFKSSPTGADIYLDDNPNPVGATDSGDQFFLTAASHRVTLKKKGYNPKTFNLTIDETTKTEMAAKLSRPVKFLAYDATNGRSHDLAAHVTKIVQNGRTRIRNKQTPVQVDLEDGRYEAFFSKEGFRDLKVTVTSKDSVVLALMEPARAHLYVVIIDQASGMPITNAEVRFTPLNFPSGREGVFNVTDAEGTCHGSLTPGSYRFSIVKDSYTYEEKTIDVRSSEVNLVEFTLIKANRG